MAQIIYQYFKKEIEDGTILVRINPESFEGLELLIDKEQRILQTKRKFDSTIYDDLNFDEFIKGSPLEFNLFLQKVK